MGIHGWGANFLVKDDCRMITASVGRGGLNGVDDVKIVQRLLRLGLPYTGCDPLVIDGVTGPRTTKAIEQFQRMGTAMPTPSGRLDPGDPHCARLVALAMTPPSRNGVYRTLSPRGRSLLQSVEALRLLPYDDQSGREISSWLKGATIGYGHLITPAEWEGYAEGISREAAEHLFAKDLQPFEMRVNRAVSVNLYQTEYDALLLLAFNIGEHAFQTSSVLSLVNSPAARTPYRDLESAWTAWVRSQGKASRGLVNRRSCEWTIFSRGIYKKW